MYTHETRQYTITMIGELKDYTSPVWKKLGDLEGKYPQDSLKVMGYFTKKNDYAASDAKGLDKVNIYLILQGDKNYFVRVPHALGVKIVRDREAFNGTIEEYLDNASIKEIFTFKTKFGSKSSNYVLW